MANIYASDKRSKHLPLKNLSSDGFTIIETLISIVLLAITLTGGISIYFYSDRVVTLMGHKKMAAEIANSRMEELRELDYSVFSSTYDPTNSPFEDSVMVGGISATRKITTAHSNPSGYMEVKVNVSWTEAGLTQPRDFEITTFIVP